MPGLGHKNQISTCASTQRRTWKQESGAVSGCHSWHTCLSDAFCFHVSFPAALLIQLSSSFSLAAKWRCACNRGGWNLSGRETHVVQTRTDFCYLCLAVFFRYINFDLLNICYPRRLKNNNSEKEPRVYCVCVSPVFNVSYQLSIAAFSAHSCHFSLHFVTENQS